MSKFLSILAKTGVTVAILLVIVGSVAAIKVFQIRTLIAASKNMPTTTESVTTALAETREWYPEIKTIGNVVANQGIMVTSEVPGIVQRIHFESGAYVEAGDLLLEINADTQRAQLRSAVASAELAELNTVRARELYSRQAIPKSDLDTSEARLREASAQVESLQALLEKTRIHAPFSGKLGIRNVNLGEFLGVDRPIVSLQSIHPVYVDSHVPQTRMRDVEVGHRIIIDSETLEEPMGGEITALNALVDASTRNILVRATVENPDEYLRPGMFVEARIRQPKPRTVLAIPVTSVLFAPYGNSVYVAEEQEHGNGLVARQRFVRLGETRGDFVEIVQGIEAGEEVVTSGAFKLRNGTRITAANERGLPYSENPQPADA